MPRQFKTTGGVFVIATAEAVRRRPAHISAFDSFLPWEPVPRREVSP